MYGFLQIGNGVHSFNTIVTAIEFYECTCNIHLVATKSSAHNYQQYSCKQHSGCNFHISFGCHHGTGLLHIKKCNFLNMMGILWKLQLRLSPAECSILPFLLYFKSYFNTSQHFFPNYFSIISLSANSNSIRT